jgi:calcium-dependent protein kinase
LQQIVQKTVLDFSGPEWKKRRLPGIDLLKKLLQVDMKLRISADQALDHDWIIANGQFTVDRQSIKKCLACISNFNQLGPLEKAVLKFIVERLFEDKDKDRYSKYFYAINRKSDGMLSRGELL